MDAVFDRVTWSQPFSTEDVARIEERLGASVPEPLRGLWLARGEAQMERVTFLRRAMVCELIETYAENGLGNLLPFASGDGSLDYALDLTGELGEGPGAVFVTDRGVMTRADAAFVAGSLAAFVARALEGRVRRDDAPSNAERWTERERERSFERFPPTLAGLGPADLEVIALHDRSWTPSAIALHRDIDIDGVPCARAVKRFPPVHLDAGGRVVVATLARDATIGGRPCLARTQLVLAPGIPTRFTPSEPMVVEGFPFAAGSEITMPTPELDVLWGVLAEPRVIDGVPCAAARVQLDARRRPTEATLSEAAAIDGIVLPAGAWFELLNGRLYAFRLSREAVVAGRVLTRGVKHAARELAV